MLFLMLSFYVIVLISVLLRCDLSDIEYLRSIDRRLMRIESFIVYVVLASTTSVVIALGRIALYVLL